MEKVRVLSELSSYDMEQEESLKNISLGQRGGTLPLYQAKTPNGKCTLFKTLMANSCKMDCKYCINSRCSKRQQEYAYTPKELAHVFMALYRKKAVQGLFLSSAIVDAIESMDNILEAAHILREKEGYKGYMHLKILPGSTMGQVKRATSLANRVSINLETVSPTHLAEIASNKDLKNDILKRQDWVRRIINSPKNRPPRRASSRSREPEGSPRHGEASPRGQESFRNQVNGHSGGTPCFPPRSVSQSGADTPCRLRTVSHTSQLMVGVNGETDREIFSIVSSEYDHMGLNRIYYSAFKPIGGTPLERAPAAPNWRQNRLYQLDWLYRVYGYSREEANLAFEGDFLENLDPKTAIARTQFTRPLEINGADEGDLLRVPGIGPKTASSIAHSKEKLKSLRDLKQHGAILPRALPFIKINGLVQTTLHSFN